MKQIQIKPIKSFNKTIIAPPDKSLTQRAILFSSLSDRKIKITNALLGEDCLSSLDCAKKLGAKADLDIKNATIEIQGSSLKSAELFVGNSGTAMRLLAGVLAGQKGKKFILDGDDSIRKRPMGRVTEPLSLMGASITTAPNNKAPLIISGSSLNGIDYKSPIASAQVKSAVLLAGLSASGTTTVIEPLKSRDHTERLLNYYDVAVKSDEFSATVFPNKVQAKNTNIVGDISSAAFPLVISAAINGGKVLVKNVGLNKTRDGILRVLTSMNASYKILNQKTEFEPYGDIQLEYSSKIKPFVIDRPLIPLLIDEIPILAVLACFLKGTSIVKDAEELKFKESNRIDTVVNALKKMGADIKATQDGMIINGTGCLKGGATIDSHGDHRIAMSMAIAGAISSEGATIINPDCAAVSYPNFYELLK